MQIRFGRERSHSRLATDENGVMMFQSILISGLAIGATYALIAISYNVMYSASRVMSFTAGEVGMLGGVLGSIVLTSGWPPLLALAATLVCCGIVGLAVELLAVRPVLAKLDQHLYVLSTLAFAILIQQLTAITWSTEPHAFPAVLGYSVGPLEEKFALPIAACIIVFVGLEAVFRYTLIGKAFIAVAEDNYLARVIGLPDKALRMVSFALAGVVGGIAGFASGQLLLAFFANGILLIIYGFIPVAMGGVGNNRGALICGLGLGVLQQAANFLVGGIFASVLVFAVFILGLLLAPQGFFGGDHIRRV
jgi:branched-chain amino acid transport system permease protein